MKRFLSSVVCCASILSGATLSAQVLMLDFGPTTAVSPWLARSPYHSATPGFTDTIWNTVGVTDVNSGLLWSNGAAASNLKLNLGATTTGTSTTIGLASQPSNGTGLTGTSFGSTGIYADTSVARDGIFTGSSSSDVRAVGLQVGGLAAGTYSIYITGRNTNTTAGQIQNFYAGTSVAAADFNFLSAGYATQALTFFAAPHVQNNAWSGTTSANYAKFTVTLGAGEFLNLAVKGGTGDQRGFLNVVQIVNTSAIPEPSSAALAAGAFALLGAAASRRRRR